MYSLSNSSGLGDKVPAKTNGQTEKLMDGWVDVKPFCGLGTAITNRKHFLGKHSKA